MTFIPDRARTLTASERWDGETETFVASTITKSAGHHGYSGPRGDGSDNLVADTLTSGSHPESNMPGRRREDDTNLAVTAFDWMAGAPKSDNEQSGDAQGRGRKWIVRAGDYAGALSASRHDAVGGVSTGVRRLTPVECERLQGFPDGWTAYGPDSRRYAALGDAVTVNVAEWIGRRLMEVAA